MSKKITYEIFWLRFIACTAVVLGHAAYSGLTLYPDDTKSIYLLTALRMGTMFATPTFVFISEFLFAKSYKNGLPKGFFKIRVKYLLIPYIIMGIVYALVFTEPHTISNISIEIIKNIIFGNFVAYFILIIFQFYLLHFILHKKLLKWDIKKVLIISLLINIIYLGVINFYTAPDNPLLQYFWGRGHWILAPGWIFYFMIGYYSGRYYDQLLSILHKYKIVTVTTPFILLSIVLLMRYLELPAVNSSKRIDVLFYTISVIFLIMYITSKIKTTPWIVIFISNYSFSIFLLHKLVVDTAGRLSDNVYIHVSLIFIIGIVFSVVVSFLLNKFPFGKYIAGKVQEFKTQRV